MYQIRILQTINSKVMIMYKKKINCKNIRYTQRLLYYYLNNNKYHPFCYSTSNVHFEIQSHVL